MPNITHAGVWYEPGHEPPGWVPPEPELPSPPPASAPKADHVEYAVAALDVPADEAEAMKKADLVDLARSAAGQAPASAAPPRRPPGPP